MTNGDSNSEIQDALDSITRVFDMGLAKKAPVKRDAGLGPKGRDFEGTQSLFTVAPSDDENAVRDFTISLRGVNAAVIARPIHRLISTPLPDSSRKIVRDSSPYPGRDITGRGRQYQFDGAKQNLERFAEVAQQPETLEKIEAAQSIAVQLERMAPCKVFMRFDIDPSGQGMDVMFTSLETTSAQKAIEAPGSVQEGKLARLGGMFGRSTAKKSADEPEPIMAKAFADGPGISSITRGNWQLSDGTKMTNGVDIAFETNRTGQSAFYERVAALGIYVPSILKPDSDMNRAAREEYLPE